MTHIAATDRAISPSQEAQDGPLILLYHRVETPPMDPQLLCVGPDRFAEHLQAVNAHGNIISMCELTSAIRNGVALPSDAFVITFDDGYADNLHHALPLLEAADAPATVFVATRDLDVDVEYWWDQLERIALVQESLPTSLTLRTKELTYTWSADTIHLSSRECVNDGSEWNVLSDAQPSPRQKLYLELFDLLRPLSPAIRLSCMEQLNQWSGVKKAARESHRRLTKDEVATLARCELIEIGAHTANHPVLSSLPIDEQDVEIGESKRVIESIIDREVSSFSYPFGTKRDYLAETVQTVRRAGFSCACSNYEGVVDSDTALFELPRVLVRDWTPEVLLDCIDEVRSVRHACG